MTDKIEKITSLIDAALADPYQHTAEPGLDYAVDEGTCWRCETRRVADGSELCAGCRAFLLEDSDVDPVLSPATPITPTSGRPTSWARASSTMIGGVEVEALSSSIDFRPDPGPFRSGTRPGRSTRRTGPARTSVRGWPTAT